MTDAMALILRVNLVLAAAVLLVLALRRPVRERFGAHLAYGLWWLVPLAGLTALLPVAPVSRGAAAANALAHVWAAVSRAPAGFGPWLAALWIVGLALGIVGLVAAQRAFARRERAGEAGPAVVGVITPRLVMPSRVKSDFSDEERALIRAHERAHMDR